MMDTHTDLQSKATRLQEICEKAHQMYNKIAYRQGNEWFDDELARMRAAVRKMRRSWQRTKTPDLKQQFTDMRNTYKKAIKMKKEAHIRHIVEEIAQQDLWNRVWKMIGKEVALTPKNDYNMEKDESTQSGVDSGPELDNDIMVNISNAAEPDTEDEDWIFVRAE